MASSYNLRICCLPPSVCLTLAFIQQSIYTSQSSSLCSNSFSDEFLLLCCFLHNSPMSQDGFFFATDLRRGLHHVHTNFNKLFFLYCWENKKEPYRNSLHVEFLQQNFPRNVFPMLVASHSF